MGNSARKREEAKRHNEMLDAERARKKEEQKPRKLKSSAKTALIIGASMGASIPVIKEQSHE